MKVAIVGRRNTGKSTFVNTLAQAERMIVSEVPGTTRDSVDVRFELDGKAFMAIDTPGLKRSKSVTTDLDFYSTHRAQRSIRRADVVLLFFDPTQRISKVDKQLCDYIAAQYKPCVFVVNKWDLAVDTQPTERLGPVPARHVPHDVVRADRLRYRPDGQEREGAAQPRTDAIQASPASRGNAGIEPRGTGGALEANPPPLHQHHPPKIYYATQVGLEPPTIVLFCNNPQALHQTYQRHCWASFASGYSLAKCRLNCICAAAARWPTARKRLKRRSRKAIASGLAVKSQLNSPRIQPAEPSDVGILANPATVRCFTEAQMIVGVPKEIKRDEYRVGILPVGVEELTRAGHQVLLEHAAPGPAPGLPDAVYVEHGAGWSIRRKSCSRRPT